MAERKSRIEKPTVSNGSLCHTEINFYAGYCPAKFMAFTGPLCHIYVMTNSLILQVIIHFGEILLKNKMLIVNDILPHLVGEYFFGT